jgi:hypothetical protein
MKRCFAASEIIRTPPFDEKTRNRILNLIGAMAEAVIGTDYLTNEVKRPAWYPAPPALDFHDANAGIASKTVYVSFICDRNPEVDRAKVVRLATERGIPGKDGQLLCIPDFMSHGAPQMFRFYEVKPDSTSGEDEGEKKVAFVRAFMQDLDLSYVPGGTWKAKGRFAFYTGIVFGFLVTISFEYNRHERIKGLVVYHFCIEVDTLVPAWLLLLILAIIIIAILFPEIPFPVPVPRARSITQGKEGR